MKSKGCLRLACVARSISWVFVCLCVGEMGWAGWLVEGGGGFEEVIWYVWSELGLGGRIAVVKDVPLMCMGGLKGGNR